MGLNEARGGSANTCSPGSSEVRAPSLALRRSVDQRKLKTQLLNDSYGKKLFKNTTCKQTFLYRLKSFADL